GLRRKRDFGHENNCGTSAVERCADGLKIDFRLAGTRDAVDQNRTCVLTCVECSRDFIQCVLLLLVQNETRRCDELLVPMRIAYHCFLAQLSKASLHERAQRLVIARSLPQELRGAHWFL